MNECQPECFRLEFPAENVDREVLECLIDFNTAQRFVAEIFKKHAPLKRSVELVVRDENELRKQILTSSFNASSPEHMQACLFSIEELRQVSNFSDEIVRKCSRFQKHAQQAVAILTKPRDVIEKRDGDGDDAIVTSPLPAVHKTATGAQERNKKKQQTEAHEKTDVTSSQEVSESRESDEAKEGSSGADKEGVEEELDVKGGQSGHEDLSAKKDDDVRDGDVTEQDTHEHEVQVEVLEEDSSELASSDRVTSSEYNSCDDDKAANQQEKAGSDVRTADDGTEQD